MVTLDFQAAANEIESAFCEFNSLYKIAQNYWNAACDPDEYDCDFVVAQKSFADSLNTLQAIKQKLEEHRKAVAIVHDQAGDTDAVFQAIASASRLAYFAGESNDDSFCWRVRDYLDGIDALEIRDADSLAKRCRRVADKATAMAFDAQNKSTDASKHNEAVEMACMLLTPQMQTLFHYLVKCERVASFDELLSVPGGWQGLPDESSVETVLKRMRGRLKKLPKSNEWNFKISGKLKTATWKTKAGEKVPSVP